MDDPGGQVRLSGQYQHSARDPGGGTVSTDPRRRIVNHDVIVSVEQLRVEPTLVFPTSTVQTGQALAEDTHNQECSHDVVRLYAHKGTMWNTDDCVPAGGHPPAMFPVASALPIEESQLDSWQTQTFWNRRSGRYSMDSDNGSDSPRGCDNSVETGRS